MISTRSLVLIAAIALLCGRAAHAQLLVPFLSKSGLTAAIREAKDSLGDDPKLLFLVTGGIGEETLSLEFNLENGRASGWAYTLYSPTSGRSMTLIVTQLPVLGFRALALGQALPLPPDLDIAIDTSGAYANSDRMVAQLKKDTTFQRYRTELPNAAPTLVSLGQLIRSDSVDLPNGFPLDQPVWTISFTGRGDSTMTCFVASKSGEHFCSRVSRPFLAVPDAGSAGAVGLELAPNPAAGRTRVTLTFPGGMRFAEGGVLALYDERGAMVLDLTGELVRNDFRFVEIDTERLPSGVYYCRASGSNWSCTAGLVVER